MRPVFGSMATAAPSLFLSASIAAVCSLGSMDVSMLAPLFSLPVNNALTCCQNNAFDSPVSSSFSEASMPRSAFCAIEKYPVIGA